jgi:hypothetical protein
MVAASLTYSSLVSMAKPFTFICNAAMVDGPRGCGESGEGLNVCELTSHAQRGVKPNFNFSTKTT